MAKLQTNDRTVSTQLFSQVALYVQKPVDVSFNIHKVLHNLSSLIISHKQSLMFEIGTRIFPFVSHRLRQYPPFSMHFSCITEALLPGAGDEGDQGGLLLLQALLRQGEGQSPRGVQLWQVVMRSWRWWKYKFDSNHIFQRIASHYLHILKRLHGLGMTDCLTKLFTDYHSLVQANTRWTCS